MNSILEQMLSNHNAQSVTEKKNSIKEVVQEIVLCGLSRAGFFHECAFYGGTALRIFYGLDRFSEDLDFSLLEPKDEFRLASYIPLLEKEVNAYGLNLNIENKAKTAVSDIQSAFVKGNTKEHMLLFYADDSASGSITGNELIKVKLEVDTTPPPFAAYEQKYRLMPMPYEVKLYDRSSLFAGKIHAVLCRAWKSRVKGRDLYDYVFYLSRNIAVNLKHLNARLVDSGFDGARYDLSLADIKAMLNQKFGAIDYEQAKNDVLPFIQNTAALELWSKEFFIGITDSLEGI